MDYQWEACASRSASKDLSEYAAPFGPHVLERDAKGVATRIQIRVLIDNPKTHLFLIGEFNDWGTKLSAQDKLEHDEHSVYATIITTRIRHNEPYGFRVADLTLADPAAPYYDTQGRSIFYDYEDPRAYTLTHGFAQTHPGSVRIIQTDLPGLITHYADSSGTLGKDVPRDKTYEFITKSGVIPHIKHLGYSAIQFLPFAQSIDGDAWKYRYLIAYPFAIKNEWGTIDEFMRMIDAFHEHGIAVIADVVLSHFPYKDFSLFGKSSANAGIHHWQRRDGNRLYGFETTEWGTMRPDFDNSHVREFLRASCMHLLKHYRIDGFRIDNVDGIIRYGANGEGEERKNGRTFLREIATQAYEYHPRTFIHLESHYFKDDNAKMLVAPIDSSPRALGATAYTSSRMTHYFHSEYMIKSADTITPWKFKHIAEEKEWGRSNSTIADFHNHDAAAGLMQGRATGSYAYDALTVNPYNHFHAIGKIKAMEAIIMSCCEGRILDLHQTFLLQTGTFEHDSSIQWYLTYTQVNKGVTEYKRAINKILDDPAFHPENTKNRHFLNVDDVNKLIVVERSSEASRYIIIVNLSAAKVYNYRVGVRTKKDHCVVLNADHYEYGGFGTVNYPEVLKNMPSTAFELLDRELLLDVIAPYGVLVLKET